MKIAKSFVVIIVFVAAVAMVAITVKSCKELSLTQQIKQNEKELEDNETKREAANTVSIPFRSDTARKSVLESANAKNGFNLYLRRPKGD